MYQASIFLGEEGILGKGMGLKVEAFSYLLMISGTLGDHLSTIFTLTRSYVYETNTLTLQLMSKGLWEATDLILIALGITIPYILIRRFRSPPIRGLLAYPIIFGTVRLGACIWNLSLII
jgi:hypothetical protein